jgi:cytochrome P450
MIRFCRQPEIPARLRQRPDLIPRAVEELLRLQPPSVAIARTLLRDAEIAGRELPAGDKVLIYWLSGNHDGDEFESPRQFDLERRSTRHLSFGAGPHRCPGSNLSRMTLRVALEELVQRLADVRLQDGVGSVPFVSAINRSRTRLPIRFTPGARMGSLA